MRGEGAVTAGADSARSGDDDTGMAAAIRAARTRAGNRGIKRPSDREPQPSGSGGISGHPGSGGPEGKLSATRGLAKAAVPPPASRLCQTACPAVSNRLCASSGPRPEGACACPRARLNPAPYRRPPKRGEVPEWSIGAVSKTVVGLRPPWVRIPPSPPLALTKAFSQSGSGRIFPLFSGVMRVWLLTGTFPRWSESVLSGPIFSRPVNRRCSGEQLQASENKQLCARIVSCQFDMPAAIRAGLWSNLRWSMALIMPPWRNHRLPLAATHEHKRLPPAPSFRPA